MFSRGLHHSLLGMTVASKAGLGLGVGCGKEERLQGVGCVSRLLAFFCDLSKVYFIMTIFKLT